MENVYDTSDFLIGQVPPLDFQQSVYHLLWKAVFEDAGRNASSYGVWRNIFSNNGTSCDDGTIPYGYTIHNGYMTTNPYIIANVDASIFFKVNLFAPFITKSPISSFIEDGIGGKIVGWMLSWSEHTVTTYCRKVSNIGVCNFRVYLNTAIFTNM